MKCAPTGLLLTTFGAVLLAPQPRPQWTPSPSRAPAATVQQAASRAGVSHDPNADWLPCARGGQTCYTPGPAQMRFGGTCRCSPTQNAVGQIDCSISTFGYPARRVEKMCEYKFGWGRSIAHPIREAHNTDWMERAKE